MKNWIKDNLSSILLTIVSTIFIIIVLKNCNQPVDNTDKLEQYIKQTNLKLDTLYNKLENIKTNKRDTLIKEQYNEKTIIEKGKVFNNYYTQKEDSINYVPILDTNVRSNYAKSSIERIINKDREGQFNIPQ